MPTTLCWLAVLFGVVVMASYIGTTAALRNYFGDDELGPSDIVRVGDDDE